MLSGTGLSLPTWTPSGRELTFVKEEPDLTTAIYVVRLDGRRSRRLLPRYRGAVADARPGSIGAMSETEPSWSPDGRRIAFEAGDGQVVIATVADGRRRTIADAQAYQPAWSPDGRLIAFSCEGALCIASADEGGDIRRLEIDGSAPSWAPDSRRVVYEHVLYGGSGYGSNPRSLSVADTAEGGVEKLTFGPSIPPSR